VRPKLKVRQVKEILKLCPLDSRLQSKTAKLYNVSQQNISAIVNRLTWKNVTL
jgi:hypothetical protein